jgi:leucyl aminopeptidase (aminopeptidase T)
MKNSARRSLQAVLGLREKEGILIVTDRATARVGWAFELAAQELKAVPVVYSLPDVGRPLATVPPELEALLDKASVVVNCFTATAEETPFRIELLQKAIDGSRRVGHAPGITEEMMIFGPMDVDYRELQKRANRFLGSLRNASYLRITAPGGTDLTLYIEGRSFVTDVFVGPGTYGNLPCGEVWCAPIESLGEGTLVCDGAVGDMGSPPSPLTLRIHGGHIVSTECADSDYLEQIRKLLATDADASILGEFGIGINPTARITDNMLEAEKAFRTSHVAFGNNEDLPGGRNHSRTNREFLFRDPTIRVFYTDGTAALVVEDGLIGV